MMPFPDSLKKYFSARDLTAGEYFVKEGETSKTIAFVNSGFLLSYQIDHKGEEVATTFFTPDNFCGSFYSFYEQKPSFENIVALTKVSLQVIHFETLHDLFKDSFEANGYGRKMIEQVCIQKDIRISKMLKLDAKNRYLWFMESYPEILMQVPLKFIASYLGMSPETLSRVRREIIS
ncbi:MAG: Crp/Fnr family transcriptional regulator [Cyclobacteriaceae bacterium]|nr:Crp/Fnr family transcriptional regulator [Cyclobacteriaceae bacterium]